MKKLLIALFVLIGISSNAKDIYLSPTGKDVNSGTITSPYFTWTKVWTVLAPGDIVYCRGGTYAYDKGMYLGNKNGTATAPITIRAYQNELPVFTRSAAYANTEQDLIFIETGNWFRFIKLEFSGFPQFQGKNAWPAFRMQEGSNNIFDQIVYRKNGSAFSLRGNSSNNIFTNCDFSENQDPYSAEPYGGGDGLDLHYITGTNNIVRGCRFWWNSDDGLDLWANEGHVLVENCWSFYNGFKPGTFTAAGDGGGYKFGERSNATSSVMRTVNNCLAYRNRKYGFVENHAQCTIELTNNTSIQNGSMGHWFGAWDASKTNVKNTISYKNPSDQFNQGVQTNNSWQGKTVNDADFKGLDETQLLAPRKADGSLPDITFYQTVPGSDLAGLGAVFSGGVIPPVNQIPTANAGADIAIQLPANGTTLNGSGVDADGTIASYQWLKVSGPTQFTLANSTAAVASAMNLAEGTYQFELTVTDNKGATGKDNVQVTVLPSIPPPPVYDTIKCNVIWYDKGSGTAPSRKQVTYIVVKPNGIFDSFGANVNVLFYIKPDGTKWSISGTKL